MIGLLRRRPKWEAIALTVRDFEKEDSCDCGWVHHKLLGVRYEIDGIEVRREEWERCVAERGAA